ncbi:hypothetical protein IW262DRAFT_902093 [Armillaria fumosa]|nr:hypothetical protein IW262DRAFT_902093 [Armillaria fumosa]
MYLILLSFFVHNAQPRISAFYQPLRLTIRCSIQRRSLFSLEPLFLLPRPSAYLVNSKNIQSGRGTYHGGSTQVSIGTCLMPSSYLNFLGNAGGIIQTIVLMAAVGPKKSDMSQRSHFPVETEVLWSHHHTSTSGASGYNYDGEVSHH